MGKMGDEEGGRPGKKEETTDGTDEHGDRNGNGWRRDEPE